MLRWWYSAVEALRSRSQTEGFPEQKHQACSPTWWLHSSSTPLRNTHFITSPWEERHAHTETSPGNRQILLRVATATSEVVREERRSRRMDGC